MPSNHLDVNEWQVAGIKLAVRSLDHGQWIAHQQVKDWIESWGSDKEWPLPTRSHDAGLT